MGKKIKKAELTRLHEGLEKQNKMLRDLGVIEDEKHVALHQLSEVKKEVQDFQKELKKTYGDVRINVQTEEITEIESE